MKIESDTAIPADRSGDWLETALREDAAEHASVYLDDEGFTASVMAALPPAMQPVPAWRKPAVTAMWSAAAIGACVALPQFAIDVGREAFSLLAAQPVSLPQIGVTLALLGFAMWSAAAYALRND
jgi:hypothetical protein